MSRSNLSLLYIFIIWLSSFSSHAALTSADWLTPGDNLITRDGNGLEWLDLTYTTRRSYNDIKSNLNPGAELAGWRYATASEIYSLFHAAGGSSNSPADYVGWSTQNNGLVDVITSFWGQTSPVNTGFAYEEIGLPSPYVFQHGLIRDVDNASQGLELTADYFEIPLPIVGPDEILLLSGHALVREVPLPSSFLLLGFALIFIRKIKTSN